MKNRDLYLDLDGVILRRTGRLGFRDRVEFEVAPNAIEFLGWCVENFQCFWLTTRSRDGSYDGIERAFQHAIPMTHLPDDLTQAIRPVPWSKAKVVGIDLTRDFRWIDDDPDQGSLDRLERAGLTDCWIEVTTDRCPDDLERVVRLLEEVPRWPISYAKSNFTN